MRFLATRFLFALFLMSGVPFARAQAVKTADAAAGSASKEEVDQLRKEVRELQALVQQLVEEKSQTAEAGGAHLVSATLVQPSLVQPNLAQPEAASANLEQAAKLQSPAPKKDLALAGFNGDHFFIRTPDGTFQVMPIGYVNGNYAWYKGDGAPSNTFALRRVRLGFQGSYGSKVDFAFVSEFVNTSGPAIRDAYVNLKFDPRLQLQVGQMKEPFAQDTFIADTNVEFTDRGPVTSLYPSAAGTFRSPGITLHGDFDGGVASYWVGAFNGKGLAANSTTNEPEMIGRLRFYPWKRTKNELLKGLAIGGAVGHGRSAGIANETSFSGLLSDNAYTFFPSFRINGGIERYNGELTWTKGPWGFRGEYDQLLEKRNNVGSEASVAGGFETLPGVTGKGGQGQLTYFLTGEKELENGPPRVKRPVIGPNLEGTGERGMGAFELKFRYSWVEGRAPGATFNTFTPTSVPTFSDHTDQFATGFNWYLNYWTLLKTDLDIDRLRTPSVQGILPQTYFVVLEQLQLRF